MLGHEEVVFRLALAAILGGAVGLERERLEWVAGLRTHMLVCLGAALIMLVSAYAFEDVISAYRVVLDPSRVAAQVVSGIGFLGAGTILFLRHEVIRGLTTAASLWTVAGVGLAIGSGLYVAGICTTALVLIILAVIKPIENRIFRRRRLRRMAIVYDKRRISAQELESHLENSGAVIEKMTIKADERQGYAKISFAFLRAPDGERLKKVIDDFSGRDGVHTISV